MSPQRAEAAGRLPYVGYFKLSANSGRLEFAIAWRREGGCDYGIYLAKPASSGLGSSCFAFKAAYGASGEARSFLVADAWPSILGAWDGDHVPALSSSANGPAMEGADEEILRQLSADFVGEWLESYGEGEVAAMLKFVVGSAPGAQKDGWMEALLSGLPAEIRGEKMPDLLSVADCDSSGALLALIGAPAGSAGAAWEAEQLARMRLFFDLL